MSDITSGRTRPTNSTEISFSFRESKRHKNWLQQFLQAEFWNKYSTGSIVETKKEEENWLNEIDSLIKSWSWTVWSIVARWRLSVWFLFERTRSAIWEVKGLDNTDSVDSCYWTCLVEKCTYLSFQRRVSFSFSYNAFIVLYTNFGINNDDISLKLYTQRLTQFYFK